MAHYKGTKLTNGYYAKTCDMLLVHRSDHVGMHIYIKFVKPLLLQL